MTQNQYLAKIKQGYNEEKSEESILFNTLQISFLVLDDLGKGNFDGKSGNWKREKLSMLIDGLYDEQKKPVITSNYGLDRLAGVIDERTASRLAEMCEMVEFKGKDWRVS